MPSSAKTNMSRRYSALFPFPVQKVEQNIRVSAHRDIFLLKAHILSCLLTTRGRHILLWVTEWGSKISL